MGPALRQTARYLVENRLAHLGGVLRAEALLGVPIDPLAVDHPGEVQREVVLVAELTSVLHEVAQEEFHPEAEVAELLTEWRMS